MWECGELRLIWSWERSAQQAALPHFLLLPPSALSVQLVRAEGRGQRAAGTSLRSQGGFIIHERAVC